MDPSLADQGRYPQKGFFYSAFEAVLLPHGSAPTVPSMCTEDAEDTTMRMDCGSEPQENPAAIQQDSPKRDRVLPMSAAFEPALRQPRRPTSGTPPTTLNTPTQPSQWSSRTSTTTSKQSLNSATQSLTRTIRLPKSRFHFLPPRPKHAPPHKSRKELPQASRTTSSKQEKAAQRRQNMRRSNHATAADDKSRKKSPIEDVGQDSGKSSRTEMFSAAKAGVLNNTTPKAGPPLSRNVKTAIENQETARSLQTPTPREDNDAQPQTSMLQASLAKVTTDEDKNIVWANLLALFDDWRYTAKGTAPVEVAGNDVVMDVDDDEVVEVEESDDDGDIYDIAEAHADEEKDGNYGEDEDDDDIWVRGSSKRSRR